MRIGALLRIVRVGDGVDERFANRGRGRVPAIVPAQSVDFGAAQRVLLHECDGFVDGLDQRRLDICVIENGRLVGSVEAPDLELGVGEVTQAISAEQQFAACRRRQSALVRDE